MITLREFFHGNFLRGHNYRTHYSADLTRYSFFCYQILSKRNLFIFFLRLLSGVSLYENFLKNYTYHTCHNRLDPELIFITDEFSRDAIFYLFFSYFLKRFHMKEFFSKIINTEPVVAPKFASFVEEFSTDAILLLFFFELLKGFYWKACFR